MRKGENTKLSMIECINHKTNIRLISEIQHGIDVLDELIARMSMTGASEYAISSLINAREQLHFERRKAENEMKMMEALK